LINKQADQRIPKENRGIIKKVSATLCTAKRKNKFRKLYEAIQLEDLIE
jgi:hypothetical protein